MLLIFITLACPRPVDSGDKTLLCGRLKFFATHAPALYIQTSSRCAMTIRQMRRAIQRSFLQPFAEVLLSRSIDRPSGHAESPEDGRGKVLAETEQQSLRLSTVRLHGVHALHLDLVYQGERRLRAENRGLVEGNPLIMKQSRARAGHCFLRPPVSSLIDERRGHSSFLRLMPILLPLCTIAALQVARN